MRGFIRRLYGSRETIRKDLALPCRVIAGERLKDHVVSALRIRRPIPGTMECNKDAISVALGKLLFVVMHHSVRPPVSRKRSDWSDFVRAYTKLLAAVTTIFRRQNQLLHERIEVAFGPTVVAALLQKLNLFGWECGFLIRLVKGWPVGVQLVAAMLRAEHASGRINCEALAVADSCRVSLGG